MKSQITYVKALLQTLICCPSVSLPSDRLHLNHTFCSLLNSSFYRYHLPNFCYPSFSLSFLVRFLHFLIDWPSGLKSSHSNSFNTPPSLAETFDKSYLSKFSKLSQTYFFKLLVTNLLYPIS